jgi:hypothetical protein
MLNENGLVKQNYLLTVKVWLSKYTLTVVNSALILVHIKTQKTIELVT